MEKLSTVTEQIILERFGKDSLISLATTENSIPYVRTVNSFYEDGAFYVLTYGLSGKMKQMEKNPTVAIAGDWFTAHGKGVNLRVDYNEAFRKENKGAGNDGSVLGDFAGMDRERAVSA